MTAGEVKVGLEKTHIDLRDRMSYVLLASREVRSFEASSELRRFWKQLKTYCLSLEFGLLA